MRGINPTMTKRKLTKLFDDNYTHKVFNKSKSHFLELHYKTKLVYVIESKGNKLIEIYSISEIEKHIEDFKKNV